MKAVLLVSHGSRSKKTKKEVADLIRQLKRKASFSIIEFAFLEIEAPSIPKGIDRCCMKGAKEVVILLNFLNAGQHVDRDIPRIVMEASKKYPHVNFRVTPPIGQHPRINELFLDLIKH